MGSAGKVGRIWINSGYARRIGQQHKGIVVLMWGKAFKLIKEERRQAVGGVEESRAKEMVDMGAIEIYTDGSGQCDGAGWGWAAVLKDKEVFARRGPVVIDRKEKGWWGAEALTNNTGELTAIIEALRWVKEEGLRKVVIRYDSEYAASMTQGKWRPKKNVAIVRQSKDALARTREAGCEVGWRHVKGHSGDKWNNRADRLADQGVRAPAGGEDATGQGDTPVRNGGAARKNGDGVAPIQPRFEAGNGRTEGNKKEPP